MNNEKHLRELIQAALDGKDIEWKEDGWGESSFANNFEGLVEQIITNPRMYRIKPEVKTFTYHTRLFFCSGRVKIWSNFSDVRNQIELEKDCNVYSDFKWLAPAQTHTIEYTE
jgi:hypothetical protein